MNLLTTILFTIVLTSGLAQNEERDFNFIKPNDDAGFFIPYKTLSQPDSQKGKPHPNNSKLSTIFSYGRESDEGVGRNQISISRGKTLH